MLFYNLFVKNRQIIIDFILIFWKGTVLTFTFCYARIKANKLLRGKNEIRKG